MALSVSSTPFAMKPRCRIEMNASCRLSAIRHRHRLEVPAAPRGRPTLLVDCGLFQGYKQLRLRNWAPMPVPAAGHRRGDRADARPHRPQRLRAAAGAAGFQGQGLLHGRPTYELCRILLPDSGHLQEEEAEYANRRGFSKHKPALPLYTREDAERCLKLFVPRPFGTPWSPAPGLQARMDPLGAHAGVVRLR
jgi:metallo-beta-lactamase family protein